MKRLLMAVALFFVGCASLPPRGLQFTPRVANNLQFLFDRVDTEFAFCVFGRIERGVMKIERVEIPFIQAATQEFVFYYFCDGPQFLGMGHSHMKGVPCQFSETDYKTLLNNDAEYGFLVCENSKFSVYSRKEVLKKKPPG